MTECQECDETDGAILTVVESRYHQRPGKEATEHNTRFYVTLKGDEQPYYRELESEQRVRLDTGWIESPSTVIIKNLKEQSHRFYLSPEKSKGMDEDNLLKVFIGASENYLIIIPGDSLRLCCSDFSQVEIASEVRVPYSITAYSG